MHSFCPFATALVQSAGLSLPRFPKMVLGMLGSSEKLIGDGEPMGKKNRGLESEIGI